MKKITVSEGCYDLTISIDDIEVEVKKSRSFADIIDEFGTESDYNDLGTCETCGSYGYTSVYELSDEHAELIFKLYNINK